MRVTIGELLGITTAQQGAAIESALYWKEWERQERARVAALERQVARALAPALAPPAPKPIEVIRRRRAARS